jgi:hypothetical protein
MTADRDGTSSSAATTRAVWWLVGGLGVTALAVVLLAPELLGDPRGLGGVTLLAMAAGIPGLLVVLVVGVRRRRQEDGSADPSDRDGS